MMHINMTGAGHCNVLAIGHDASLTGAPLLLLSYLKEAIEQNPALSARAFLLGGGELAAEYAHLCDTYIPQAPHGATLWQRFIFKIKRKMRVDSDDERLKRWLGKSPSPDVIYVNTVASISALKRVLNCLSRAPKTVIHVHELDWLLMKYQSMDNIKEQLDNAYRVIAPSVSVAHALEHRLSIPASKIELIHEWVCRPINVEDYTAHYRSLVRAELGLGPSDILCLSVGRAQWRKGSDLMPLIAKRCSQANPSIRFAWVGDCSEDERIQQDLECKKLGLTDTLYWIKEQADPYPYLAAADLYLLPSREDPYPVAMLEAALFGLPIICFEQGGGAPEFIQSGGGVAVPYLDIDRFSAEILGFASQPGLRAVMGDAAKICALQSHTIKHAEPLISKVLADAVQQ